AYELVWAGGKASRPAAQALYWSMQLRDAVEERLSQRRELARWRAATAPVLAPTARARDEVPIQAEPVPAMADAPASREVATGDFAPASAREDVSNGSAWKEAHAESARRALEAAARAAQNMAEEFARARARAEGAWSKPAEPEALLAASPEEQRPDDAAPVKIGDFAPQFIAPGEAVPTGENPVPAENVAPARRPRWLRSRRSEA